MDKLLRVSIERAVQNLNLFIETCGPVTNKRDAAIQFHLIQAKQAMMRAITTDDKSDFVSRRLIEVYESQLKSLAKHDDSPIS